MTERIPIQVVPETWSDERMHVLDETCWCGPVKVREDTGDTNWTYRLVHRGAVDVADGELEQEG